MEIVKFIYKEKEVDFLPSGNDNLMVNATQMAKIFGKEIMRFNELESTKKFIEACLNYRFSRYNNDEISEDSSLIGIKKKDDLIVSKQKSGTWMHRILALKFAAWLDPDFEVWVFETIDKIIFGHYREIKESIIEKLRAEKAVEEKKAELIEKYPEFIDFLQLEGKLSEAEKQRIKAVKEAGKQMKLDLFKE